MMLDSDRVLDLDSATRELLRAVRGRRSQVAFARRLGYRGNPVADWEAGRRAPTAERALEACARSGIDVAAALARFHAAAPPDLAGGEPLCHWLERLRGRTPVADLARRSGCSRHQISRWLGGHAQPRVPDFLRLVEAMTGRVSDLVAELVPIERVPSLLDDHRQRDAARRLASEEPWTEAILRVLESDAYRALPRHAPGFVARYLGIDREIEERCLAKLQQAGVVRPTGAHLQTVGTLTVDTHAVVALKAHWARTALARLPAPGERDLFSYNVFSASAADLTRIRELLRGTYREIRALVADTPADEEVALLNLQLLHWQRPPSDAEPSA